jgi:arylsulfatase A-like enzyme
MGYGDTGFNGCKDIPTPQIDSIAKNGVRFSAGYVTAPQCAPSRSGLLSGRYQNTFGCEENSTLDNHGITRGIRLFGDYMHLAGYRTGIVGKWHLGTMEECHPLERGFDFFFGFLQGSNHYFPPGKTKTIPNILDGHEPQKVSEYLTFVLGDQAIRFIKSSQGTPFFLYLAFNAPHSPLQAPENYLVRFAQMENPTRKVYAAMVAALDDTIGRVLASLRQQGIEDNTLVVFLSDNGGPTSVTAACNDPLRGVKGETLEGRIRVPFAMQWKSVIPTGQTIDAPVSSLDLLPTAMAAAGAEIPKDAALDGRNLVPLLTSKTKAEPRTLTWRFPFPSAKPELYVWAVRQGNLKLVKEVDWKQAPGKDKSASKTKVGLYQLSADMAENNDLSAAQPEKRQQLQALYDAWNATLPAPSTEGKKSPKRKKP